MEIDLISTTKEWLAKHRVHIIKQYYTDSLNETHILLKCDNCGSIKNQDKIVHNTDLGDKS